jgi:hypothetical protein
VADAPQPTGRVEPCRPYRIGDHARAIRNRMLVSMLISVPIAAAATVIVPIGLALAVPGEGGLAASSVAAAVTLPAAFVIGHWALLGPRRWTALEILIWGGRLAAAGFAATTGIRDPADRPAAAAWLASHPVEDEEEPAVTYWRAYVRVLTGDPDGARAEIARLEGVAGYDFARAELLGEIDLSEGKPVDLAALGAATRAIEDPFQRAFAAANLAALGAQLAWTCGHDNVAPVLAVRPLVGTHARGFMLRHYWLPFVAVTAASAVVFSIVRPFG